MVQKKSPIQVKTNFSKHFTRLNIEFSYVLFTWLFQLLIWKALIFSKSLKKNYPFNIVVSNFVLASWLKPVRTVLAQALNQVCSLRYSPFTVLCSSIQDAEHYHILQFNPYCYEISNPTKHHIIVYNQLYQLTAICNLFLATFILFQW